MTGENEARDEAMERRDGITQPAPVEAETHDVDDDDVDAHVWRAQT
jgi:hypothetical protein